MQRSRDSSTCVFCGKAIGPDEPASGRPPMAAHAACADAALADDRHWDAVAGSQPETDATDAPTGPGRPDAPARKTGCLAIAIVVLVVVAILFG